MWDVNAVPMLGAALGHVTYILNRNSAGQTIGWAIRDVQQRSGDSAGRCGAAPPSVESGSGNHKRDVIR